MSADSPVPPSDAARSVTLSDGSVWELFADKTAEAWICLTPAEGRYVPRGGWRYPALWHEGPLTAADHRAIADVLDGVATAPAPEQGR